MRARMVFIVLAILLVAGFAALNWAEFSRPTTLSFGFVAATLPLGVVMLSILGIVLAVFLLSSAAQESRHLLEHRRTARALQAQRDLAEKAEASRFTDLRQHMDNQLREVRQRDAVAGPEAERNLLQGQRELRAQMDQMLHVLASRIGDLESRLAGREPLVREPLPEHPETPAPVEVPVRDRVRL